MRFSKSEWFNRLEKGIDEIRLDDHFLIYLIEIGEIKFQVVKSDNTKIEFPYPEYPTPNKTYNNVFDVKRKLHLFTKTANSKCLHAAGWYVLSVTNTPEVVFCPKYIFIQRYPYEGPFKSEDEANSHINS